MGLVKANLGTRVKDLVSLILVIMIIMMVIITVINYYSLKH